MPTPPRVCILFSVILGCARFSYYKPLALLFQYGVYDMAYFRRRGCKCPNKKKCKCDAKWSFTIDIGTDPQTGERKQATRSGFVRKIDAEEAAAALLLELKTGSHIKESNLRFNDFVEEWTKDYEGSSKIKISTLRSRKYAADKFMPYFAHIKMKDITRKKYQDALNDLKSQGLSDNTLDGIHNTGKMMFNRAIEFNLIKGNPTKYARVHKTKKTVEEIEQEAEQVKYLEKEELSKFLNTAKEQGKYQDYAIFLMLAYSGMRVGELCALKWKDIDFEAGTVSITKTYYSGDNKAQHYELLTPKTKTSRRKITIENIVLAELEKHKARQNVLRMKFRSSYHDQDFVFVRKGASYVGLPINTQSVGHRMTAILKLAGLNEELTPHSLRHTHTSLLAEAEVGLLEIMDRLGHKDDQTTKNVYLHVTKKMEKVASQKFGELMKNL